MSNDDFDMELIDECSTDHSEDIDNTSESYNEKLSSPQSVRIMQVTPEGVPYWLPNVPNDIKPVVGMSFDSIDVAYEFYIQYAKQAGFPSKKSSNNRNKQQQVSRKYFLCSKHSLPKLKIPLDSLEPNGKKHRKTSSQKCGCKAKLILKLNKVNNKYEVEEFSEPHNHDLVHNNDKHYLTCNRKLSYSQKLTLRNLANINVGPSRGFKVLKQTCGGFDKVGATLVDCKNFKRDVNAYIGEHDAQMLIDKLKTRKKCFPDFSFEYCQGEIGELSGIFWSGGESKRNYIAFGDVVGFDATFRTNLYYMVFVPFTGIDNHNRCVTFGVGLLTHETIEAYTWLLEAFKKNVGGEPSFFISDQDPAIKQAMKKVFPSTKHRLCMWHITDKFTTKTNKPEEFEEGWASIIDKYNLQEHKWLYEIYAIRQQWIPAYFRDMPLASLMQTTSRCERSNYFFGVITNDDLHLFELLTHFDIAMQIQQYKNDHDSRFKTPNLLTVLPMEREATKFFTRYAFFEIQRKMLKSMLNIGSDSIIEIDGSTKYVIRDVDEDIKFRGRQEVYFNKRELTISCSCKLFKLEGFLCRHCLYVLRMSCVKEFPKKYILRRWLKDVVPPPHDMSYMRSRELGDNKEEIQTIIRDSYFYIDSAIDCLVNDVEKLALFRDEQKKLMQRAFDDMPLQPPMKNKQVIETLLGVSHREEINVKVPNVSRNKGCGSNTKSRVQSGKEKAIAKAKKQIRACKYCGEVGHYINTCKRMAEDDASKRINQLIDEDSTSP